MRVACLQFAPSYSRPSESMLRADALLLSYFSRTLDGTDSGSMEEGDLAGRGVAVSPSPSFRESVDILLLPEMAFTGYIFNSRAEIAPLCEPPSGGATIAWCRRWAALLACVVVCGYPRRGGDGDGEEERLYNSQCVVSAAGDILAIYDKTFLYATDKVWASAGERFQYVDLPPPLGVRAGLGICMDINPEDFVAPFTDFELAHFWKNSGVQIALFSSAWCNRHPDDPPDHVSEEPDSHETLQYWATRLIPLFGTHMAFVCADRVGKEGMTTFCGTSCVMSMRKHPTVLECLNTTQEGVLVREVELCAATTTATATAAAAAARELATV